MNDAQKSVRVTLGPVARNLIDGSDGNPGKALDNAIEKILEDASTGPSPSSDLERLREDVAELRQTVDRQKEVMFGLRDLMILEQRMTRIFVASILSDDSEEQRQIIAMAGEAVEGLIERKGLADDLELDQIKDRQDVAEEVLRRELDRGDEAREIIGDEELER